MRVPLYVSLLLLRLPSSRPPPLLLPPFTSSYMGFDPQFRGCLPGSQSSVWTGAPPLQSHSSLGSYTK